MGVCRETIAASPKLKDICCRELAMVLAMLESAARESGISTGRFSWTPVDDVHCRTKFPS